MASNLIMTVFSALFALLLSTALGAFLLAVPAMSLLSVILVLTVMILMFALGLYAGGRRIRIRRRHI